MISLAVGQQAVAVHAGHVLLDDGLEAHLHRLLLGQGADQVLLEQGVGLETVERRGLLAIELQHQVALDKLIDSRVVTESP